MDDMGGTPTPMNAANRAQQAYAAAGRDKRKRKVRSSWQKIPAACLVTCLSWASQLYHHASLGGRKQSHALGTCGIGLGSVL